MGTPQINVSFDIDTNAILNVSATEKSTGKSNKITITNDKGRLSKEEIERMVQEAERYKAEDERNKDRIESKNHLENFAYSAKNSMNEEKLKEKISAEDKATVEKACEEALAWLDANANAEKEEYEKQQKDLEAKINPIMMKAYQAAGGAPGGGMPDMSGMGGMGGQAPGGAPSSSGGDGVTIEEVD